MMRVMRGMGIFGRVMVTVYVAGRSVFCYQEPLVTDNQRPGTTELVRALTWDGGIREVFEAGVRAGRILEKTENTT